MPARVDVVDVADVVGDVVVGGVVDGVGVVGVGGGDIFQRISARTRNSLERGRERVGEWGERERGGEGGRGRGERECEGKERARTHENVCVWVKGRKE